MGFGLVFTCYILIFCLSFYQFTPTILHLRIQNFGILQIFQISCNFYFILLWLNYFPEAKIRLSIVSQKNKLPSKLLFVQAMVNSETFLQHGFKSKISNLFSLSASHTLIME